MGIYLNPGNWMFQDTLNGQFYIDKTGIASFVNATMNTPRKFSCVSRPRRFGKSVDADMLVAYYSKGADSRAQFEGLAVSHDPTFEAHLNAHNVIKLNIVQMLPFSDGLAGVGKAIAAEVIPELRATWSDIVPDDETSLPKALTLVYAATGSRFVFVVDEWDCVMREAADDEPAQKAYLDFLRDLFKDRPYVDAVYMTGILPIKKYGRHSALNLFTEYSIVDPKTLDRLFGFNACDVERLCGEFGMDYAEMARWYDGYLLGPERIHVYNPRSVAGAIGERQYSSFWTQTETFEALQRYIDIDFDGVQHDLVAMLDGARVPANVGLFENDMVTFKSKDDVYALLVHLGYLGYDQVERAVFIPNEEIRREFANAVQAGARPQLARLVAESRELARLTLAQDEEYVADAVGRAHDSAAGLRYYNDEQALRAAVKLAYIWSIDDYLRVDELPGGRGFADVAFIPKPGSALPPMIVELKWNKPVEAALGQIRARNYPAVLQGLDGECLLVGITYDEKTCEHSCTIERVSL
ncbi:MAG: AAA family ATPase [Eggerthellaceae bacterium]|nr:AAA family ATPase [Eggerthellaceae bacterium]